jgi:hypothetical protein
MASITFGGETGRELQALDGDRLVETEMLPLVDDAEASLADGVADAELRVDELAREAERVAPRHGAFLYHDSGIPSRAAER